MEKIIELMRLHKVPEAFEQLVPQLATNEQARSLFLELLRTGANLHLLKDYAELIEKQAKAGNPWMQFAWARYHDCVQPEAHSNAIMEEYYLKADQAGIADAHMCLAFCWRDGDLGMIDLEKYAQMRQEAVDRGSHTAVQQHLRDMMNGRGGFERDPWQAYELLDKFVRQSEANGDHFDPRYLHVLADIANELGRKAEADLLYEKALKAGDTTSWFWLVNLRCCDEKGNITDTETCEQLMNEYNDYVIPEVFSTMQLCMAAYNYDELDEDLQHDAHQMLKDNLELSYEIGDAYGAFSMGYNYYLGQFGFEENNAEAWRWFARAALMRSSTAYYMMAQMIADEYAPEGYDEEFQHICELRALRLGEDECLGKVVQAYKHGFLTDFALEIEKYHLPAYEAKEEEEDDDEYDEGDDGRYDAYA
ncbi:MAG: hypothetical protein IJS82_02410 [Paludibacteraceae bacterium]|nr:hypothetical protein [Paludibacteraceae bacterium]